MKRITISFIFTLCVICNMMAKKNVVWENPALLYVSESYLSIKSVTFADTATVVEVLALNPEYNIRFSKETYLQGGDGKKYMVRYCKEYPLDSWMPVKKKPETVVTLVFESMPRKQTAIDLIEGYDSRNVKFYGIHNAKKPLKVKSFPYEDNALNEMRRNFFTTDSVCVKGKFESVPDNRSAIIYYDDILADKDYPIAISINEDGTFERKFKVEHPLYNVIYLDNHYLPFFVMPGHTVNITIHKDGSTEYCDENGKTLVGDRFLQTFARNLDNYSSKEFQKDLNTLNFKEYGKKTENVLAKEMDLCNYIAHRNSFSQVDYMLSKNTILVNRAQSFLDYQMYKLDEVLDSVGKAEVENVENYEVLRFLPFNDPLILIPYEYSFLQNRYSHMAPMWNIYYKKTDDGDFVINRFKEKVQLCKELDCKIFGQQEPSILHKVDVINGFNRELEPQVSYVSSMTAEDVEWINEYNENKRKDCYEFTKSYFEDPALKLKVESLYQNHLNTKDFTYELPNNQATEALRRVTDKFKGKYVLLDFWSTGCGPCRANIEATEVLRDSLRNLPDVAFVFLTSDYESPEGAYNDYVVKHLKNDYSFRVSKEDYQMFRELFQFNGIPHYEVLDKQGNVIRIDSHWFSKETFDNLMNNIRSKLE